MAVEELRFRIPSEEDVTKRLLNINPIGQPLHSNRAVACSVCKRSVLPLGVLPFPRFPLCSSPECQVTKLSVLNKLFLTPYGCAIHLDIMHILTTVKEFDGYMFLLISPIYRRAESIAAAYVDLLKWQQAFDLYERLENPRGYSEGRVSIIPPRRIDEVVALRAFEDLVPLDPTRRFPDDIAVKIKRIRKKGISGFVLPF